jgi:hypothetical protein
MLLSQDKICFCRNVSPVPVAERFKAGSAAASIAGTVGSNPPESCLFLANIICCEVEDSATGRSLVQRSPADCDVPLSVTKTSKPPLST